MTEAVVFSEVIQNVDELRSILGHPSQLVIDKVIHEIDEYAREFIAHAPFIMIGSSDAQGNADVSPKGDPAGFVQILNNRTLLIPDRPGNRRADTLINILEHPQMALIFLIPGKRETLRVNGRAQLIRDADLRERCAVNGKIPALLIAVTVEDVYFHCPKCIIRSGLWEEGAAQQELASLAEAILNQTHTPGDPEELQREMDEDYKKGIGLY
ncbi:MAG: pyridoxamine 5'-phosphate oxidase family protein [Chloroflexi bacterium]|nr:pyridoxamine 5'-phosphate oxidase family protein [Chloroflexota bacterium]